MKHESRIMNDELWQANTCSLLARHSFMRRREPVEGSPAEIIGQIKQLRELSP